MQFKAAPVEPTNSQQHGRNVPVSEEDLLLDNFYMKKQSSNEPPKAHFHMDMGAFYIPPEPTTLRKGDSSQGQVQTHFT
jgi:hypothetical protein